MRVMSRRVSCRVNDIGGIERREERVRGNTIPFFLAVRNSTDRMEKQCPVNDRYARVYYMHSRASSQFCRCTEVQLMHFCSLLSLRNMNLSHFQESAINRYIFNVLIINCVSSVIIINCYRVNRISGAWNAADISSRFEERRKKEKKCRKRN